MLALSAGPAATSKFAYNALKTLLLVKNRLALQLLLPATKIPNWLMEFVFSIVGTDSITIQSKIDAWPVSKIA